MTTDLALRVFADANVLAKPLTRSILWFAAEASGYSVTWSEYADTEADRHLHGARASMSVVRARAGLGFSPTGHGAERFATTKESDRQILADAVAAKAWFLVTEDVDDFGQVDLYRTGVTAVHYDLFLAERTTSAGYLMALRIMSEGMSAPPRTVEELHTRLGRVHPLTVAKHADVVAATPDAATHNPPAVIFRGPRCLRCLRIGAPNHTGVCEQCSTAEGSNLAL